MKFKKGDRVKCINPKNGTTDHGSGWVLGKEFITLEPTPNEICWPEDGSSGVYFDSLELVTNNNKKTTNMTLLSQIKALTRSEPEKTFVKAGVMNEDLTLTTEGKDLFLDFMLEANKDAFKAQIVDKIIEAQEAEKK